MVENRSMVEDAMIVMSGDMFERIYGLSDNGWPFVVETIKDWANEFVSQLDWQGDGEERDWIFELEAFEDRKFNELADGLLNKIVIDAELSGDSLNRKK